MSLLVLCVLCFQSPDSIGYLFYSRLKDALVNRKFVDLTVICGEKIFYLHRFVLSIFSSFFAERHHSVVVNAPDQVQPEMFELLLIFIYGGEITIGQEDYQGFLTTAKMLGMDQAFRNIIKQ